MTKQHLLALLDAHVRRNPSAVACVGDTATLSYGELGERSSTLAAKLRAAGVEPGDRVGVFAAPTIEVVVAVWAILRAGATYVPLAVDYPSERLTFIAADSAVRAVCVDASTVAAAHRIAPESARTIRIDEPDTEPPAPASSLPFAEPAATTAAYVIYTSGTTGTPKGVLIPHQAITNQMRWLADEFELSAGARILWKTPVGFDAAQWELLANACGAAIVIAPAGTHTSPEDIVEYVLRESITVLQCVPTMWAELVESRDLSTATTLRTVVSGGEALPTPLALRMRATLPATRKINLYGPTETTINATWFDFTTAELDGSVTVPIGKAAEGVSVAVVDESLRPLPTGSVGELLVGGVQVAEGYLGLPAATAHRFIEIDHGMADSNRMYRTGDLVRARVDGVLEFVGRNDEQVKVDGHRVETNEVRVRIEAHHWVRAAAVVPVRTPRGATRLAGFIELDPAEAPLMDQGLDARHHRSKSTHLQVSAQLADLAVRDCAGETEILLAARHSDEQQRRRVFARKTYRTFADRPVDLDAIHTLLEQLPNQTRPQSISSVEPLTATALGALLRWFGPFYSRERLLPKYSYASPGALNATRIYVETGGIPGLAAGVYYFHPLRHALFRVGEARRRGVHLHLVGISDAIEAVYSTNVREVLQFEAGHLLGVLDEVSAELGWRVHNRTTGIVGGITEGTNTASVELVAGKDNSEPDRTDVTVLVQVQGGVEGARPGLYTHTPAGLIPLTEKKVERRHVIAINQRSYDRAAFGVVLLTPRAAGWDGFTALGRTLAHLQQLGSRTGFGFMSAGYSSLTGRDLPSARRIEEIRGTAELSYFALAGPVTAEQLAATDMAEDAVHMQGPEELLKDDLRSVLPHYMVPATIQVLDRIPHSSNGKQDRTALVRIAEEHSERTKRIADPPTPGHETEVAQVWSRVLDYGPVYRTDDFFANGGNSLAALRLVRALNDELGVALPVQTIFHAPTPRQLAAEISRARSAKTTVRRSRLLRLAGDGDAATTVLWPGLGGYPMSLRHLAGELAEHGHTVYGVQARGINAGELPHRDLTALVDDDVQELLALGRRGPLRIVGYSFGARVAAEAAQQLTTAGHEIDQLVLIAPGSPVLPGTGASTEEVSYRNHYFKRVLASVFSGRIDPVYATELDTQVDERTGFIDLVVAHEPDFARDTVERIVAVVEHTYRFRAEPCRVDQDLLDRSLFLRARGDGPSFADIPPAPLRPRLGPVSNLPYHHYEIVTAGALDIAAAVLERTVLVPNRNRELV